MKNGQHALDPVRRACPARPLIRPPLLYPAGHIAYCPLHACKIKSSLHVSNAASCQHFLNIGTAHGDSCVFRIMQGC